MFIKSRPSDAKLLYLCGSYHIKKTQKQNKKKHYWKSHNISVTIRGSWVFLSFMILINIHRSTHVYSFCIHLRFCFEGTRNMMEIYSHKFSPKSATLLFFILCCKILKFCKFDFKSSFFNFISQNFLFSAFSATHSHTLGLHNSQESSLTF